MYFGPPLVCVGILVGFLILLIQNSYGVTFISRFKIIYSMIIISLFLLHIISLFQYNRIINNNRNILNIFLLLVYLISNWTTLIILELISIAIFLVKSIFKYSKGKSISDYRPASGYNGVMPNKKRWMVKINYNGKRHYLGTYDTKQEAALVYDETAMRCGEEKVLNFDSMEDAIEAVARAQAEYGYGAGNFLTSNPQRRQPSTPV